MTYIIYVFFICTPGLPPDPRTKLAWRNPTTGRETHENLLMLSTTGIPNVPTFVPDEVRQERASDVQSELQRHTGFTLGLQIYRKDRFSRLRLSLYSATSQWPEFLTLNPTFASRQEIQSESTHGNMFGYFFPPGACCQQNTGTITSELVLLINRITRISCSYYVKWCGI